MTHLSAIDNATRYFDTGGFVHDLGDLVSYETESQTADKAAELPRHLNEALIPRPITLGFDYSVHPNPV